MRKTLIVFAGVIFILVGFSIYGITTSSALPEVAIVKVENKEVKNTVLIPGDLMLSEVESFTRENLERKISEVYVKEGEKVKKGSPLYKYSDEEVEYELKQNQITREEIYHRINSLKKDLSKLYEANNQNLKDEINQVLYDLRSTDLELQRADLENKSIERRRKELIVYSQINGTVIKENFNDNNTDPEVLKIANKDSYEVKGLLSEYDLESVKTGQNAVLRSEALEDLKLKGEISSLGFLPTENPEQDTSNELKKYDVTVKINTPTDESLRPGYKFLIEIETDKQTVKALPNKVITKIQDKNYVFLYEDERAILREVKLGTQNNEFSEVIEGLNDKDHVIVNPSGIEDNMEVKLND